MFTICPKCMLTLAVTAGDLRLGQGYVSCGRCANVFNALLALSEEPGEEDARQAEPLAADRASSSQIAAAMRAADAVEDPAAAAAAAAAPEAAPAPAASAVAVEPAEASGLPGPGAAPGEDPTMDVSNLADGTGTFETIVLEGEAITQIEEYVPEASVDREIAAITEQLARSGQWGTVGSIPTHATGNLPSAPPYPAGTLGPDPSAADIDALRQRASAGAATRRRWPWIAGSTSLALLLALQAVHHWRDALAASSPFDVILTRAYAAMGMPLDPHWDLAAYEVRQEGSVIDPADGQIIRVKLSLANHAPRAQPLPMLRLTLLDRYGKRIATSELDPGQYWPAGAPPRAFLGHDERVDSGVAVRDPGSASSSFELDVCLRGTGGVLHCAGDAGAGPAAAASAGR